MRKMQLCKIGIMLLYLNFCGYASLLAQRLENDIVRQRATAPIDEKALLGNMYHSKSVDLKKIDIVPQAVWDFKDLTSLEITGSEKMSKIDEQLGLMNKLTILTINYTSINELPKSITKLKSLYKIRLYRVPITQLPDSMALMPALKDIFFNEVPIIDVPVTFEKAKNINSLFFTNLAGKTKLANGTIIERQGWKTLPKHLCRMQFLKGLDVTNSGLEYLSNDIIHLSSLDWLTLKNNKLSVINPSLGKLRLLRSLDLSGNPISDIPESVLAIPTLRKLYLTGSHVTEQQVKVWRARYPKLNIYL